MLINATGKINWTTGMGSSHGGGESNYKHCDWGRLPRRNDLKEVRTEPWGHLRRMF